MDLAAAIGMISSLVTLEEAGRSWVLIIKDKLKRKEIDINNWDSDDPLVQACLDRFKTDMGDKYKDHIFSEEEIQEIIRGFFEQNRELRIGYEEKKQMTQIIEDILYAYNKYTKSLMSSGERTLHNTLSSDFSKIMDKLGVIEEQPRKENIKKFLRAIEISKEIELENIEELINGEYEINRSEIIETIQAGREKLVSIQGNAGSGKSVVCKKLLKGKEYVLVTRAENLSTGKKVNELWDCDVEDAILWLENKPLYIFIDAIEFIADCGDNAFPLLQEIYRLADKYSNVYIITSCRTTDSSAFMKINTKYRIKTYEIPDLTKDEIDKVAKSYPIILSLQQNKKYSDLLCVPFYLNLIVSGGFVEENINDENNFRNLIWERIICLKDKCRKYGVLQSDVRKNVERIVFERAILNMNETLNRLINDINEKKADAGQIVSVINTLCEKMKGDYRIEMQFESVLVTLIASVLIMPDVTDEQRNKLVEEWIKRIKKIFLNQSYVAEVNMVIALWEQLNQDINNDLKQQILLIILESIINDDNSGLISQMAELSKCFLTQNKRYASCIFNTIIMLAEDEMNHQKFNVTFIKENRNNTEYEFIPNMVPKLHGVDHWIRDNKGNEYQNKKSQIIQDYLYDGKSVDFTEFDISNYDIDILYCRSVVPERITVLI